MFHKVKTIDVKKTFILKFKKKVKNAKSHKIKNVSNFINISILYQA